MSLKFQYLVPRFDPQGHPAAPLHLAREMLREKTVQSALGDAKARGIDVQCLCRSDSPLLLSTVAGPKRKFCKFYLSRRPSDGGVHALDCPHGLPSKVDLASNGYTTTAVSSTESGSRLIRIGGLLAAGPVADEESKFVGSGGSGCAAPQRLRNSAGLMGLLSWLLHEGKLNVFDRSRGVFDFWNELRQTALELQIDGLHALGPMSDRLLLGPTGYDHWHTSNKSVVEQTGRRTGLFVLFAPITRSALPDRGLIDLTARFGAPVVMRSETLDKALRPRKFVGDRYREGKQFLAFGRAYPDSLRLAGGTSRAVWMVDRLAVMATEPTLFPVARARDLAKAREALKALDSPDSLESRMTYEGYLPYDK